MSNQPELLRLFIALHVPEEVKARLAEAQREMREQLPPKCAAWTRPEGMHLTLRFLGAVVADGVDDLTAALRRAVEDSPSLSVRCDRLGCFPDMRFPRVVWAWVHDSDERLAELHERVETATASMTTQPREKRFVSHVTLARIKRIKRPEAEIIARFVERQVDRFFGEWRVGQVSLMRSKLLPQGSEYAELAALPLKES